MKCESIEIQLLQYLNEELSDKDKKAVEEHLSTCNHCQESFVSLQASWKVFDVLKEQVPSEQLKERFDAMLEKEKRQISGIAVSFRSIQNLFTNLWPSKPVWALCYSLVLLFSGITTGQVLPQNSLPFVEAFTGSPTTTYSSFADIPEDSLVQWCSVQNSPSPNIL